MVLGAAGGSAGQSVCWVSVRACGPLSTQVISPRVVALALAIPVLEKAKDEVVLLPAYLQVQ